MQVWPMRETKSRVSKVVKVAESQGPQEITVHGGSAAVVLSRADFDKLPGTAESLVAFMRRSPLAGEEGLDFPRDNSLTRDEGL